MDLNITDEEWREHFLPAYYPKRTEGLPADMPRAVEGLTGTLRPAIEAGLAAISAHRAKSGSAMNTYTLSQRVREFENKCEDKVPKGMDAKAYPETLRWWKESDGTVRLQQAWHIRGVAWIWLDVPTDDANSPQ